MVNKSIDSREGVVVKVDELLEHKGWDTLREVELDESSNFNRTTVVRWQLYPHEVYRLSIYALYKFLRSLGYTHRQVGNLRIKEVLDIDEYEELFSMGNNKKV